MLPFKSTLVSCGEDYTVLLTENSELLVSGRLPNKECIRQFEQLAKFEPTVVVHQIESSLFTTIVAKLPGQERNELFLWGDSPLGNFQEPISLNQLINETQPDECQLDIKQVSNGAHFCILVERQSGLTY